MQRIVILPEQVSDRQITLTESQQHYLVRVLRLEGGDRFIAIDGHGQTWLAALTQTSPSATAEIISTLAMQTELPVSVTLVAALPKGNGFDEVVRQATELGVAQIVPIISDRTLLAPSPQKLDRWRRIAQEAAEQSERQIVPTICQPQPFLIHLQQAGLPQLKLLCEARGNHPHVLTVTSHLTLLTPAPSLLIAIGPEGGWSDAEVAAAIAAGYQPVSLGARILRAVTAPLVALSLINGAIEGK